MFASVGFIDIGIAKSKITGCPLPYVCLLFRWTKKGLDADGVIDMLWQLYSNDFYILKWNRFATELIDAKGFFPYQSEQTFFVFPRRKSLLHKLVD